MTGRRRTHASIVSTVDDPLLNVSGEVTYFASLSTSHKRRPTRKIEFSHAIDMHLETLFNHHHHDPSNPEGYELSTSSLPLASDQR